MLRQIAEGTWLHESDFLQSNAVVVLGDSGVLLIDPGITSEEMELLANDLDKLGQTVAVAFSTHPHWDHLLWHARFGDAPRYGTARNVAEIRDFMSNANWREQAAQMLPQDLADKIPLNDTFARITELPSNVTHLPWAGPKVQIVEHQGHAIGSAALFIEKYGVLVAGDMVSNTLTPFLEFDVADPVNDYLSALNLFESLSDSVKIFVPGHGSVGDANELRKRIKQDREYVMSLHDGGGSDDNRLTDGPLKDLLASVHKWHLEQIAQK